MWSKTIRQQFADWTSEEERLYFQLRARVIAAIPGTGAIHAMVQIGQRLQAEPHQAARIALLQEWIRCYRKPAVPEWIPLDPPVYPPLPFPPLFFHFLSGVGIAWILFLIWLWL